MPPTLPRPNKKARLVDVLAARFQAEVPDPQLPLIIENALAGGRSRHLLVIWDAWQELPPLERSKIIMDGYAKAFPQRVRNVTIAMGLTAREALSMGYLKYAIQALVRPTDKISPTRLRTAMESVGGVLNTVGQIGELRFAHRDQAEQAYRKLQEKLPGPFWAIVQESSALES